MTTDEPKAKVRVGEGTYYIQLPNDDEEFQVVSWLPPRLTLSRGDEIRALFLSPGENGEIWLGYQGQSYRIEGKKKSAVRALAGAEGHEDLSSPMPGKVLEVLVSEGDNVAAGDRLLILEAMKMESPIRAPHDSKVSKLHVAVGDNIDAGDILIELDAEES